MVTTRDAKPDAHDITCRQAVALMTDYLDGALGPDDRALMEAHLAECESCAESRASSRNIEMNFFFSLKCGKTRLMATCLRNP